MAIELPEIEIVDTDATTIEAEVIAFFEAMTKRTLSQADPERIALMAITQLFILRNIQTDRVAKGVLLPYAQDAMLDYIGALYNLPREEAKAARTTIRVDLSIPLSSPIQVPLGTRIGPSGGDGSIYFSTAEPIIIPSNTLTYDIPAVCNLTGEVGNGFLPGQLNKLMDPLPFVRSVQNVTTSAGGSNREDKETYRERIRTAPESFAVAGPEDAYVFFAKSASPLISDVKVVSEEPYKVKVVPLLHGGELPGDEIISAVLAVLSPKNRRPLNDLVVVEAPQVVSYSVDIEYTILESQIANMNSITAAVQHAVNDYILWQKSKLGRDINPSELISRVKEAGAYRVTVNAPLSYTEVDNLAVAIANENPTVTFGGMTND